MATEPDSGLERLTGDAYTHEVLYVAGDEYVIRFVPKKIGLPTS